MRHAREDYARIQDPAGLIPEDEPVFLLRGQDSLAGRTVMLWAILAENSGASPAIVEKAKAQAAAMRAWASKVPDLPGDPAPTAPVGLPIMNGDHAEFEREHAGQDPKTRPDWPYPSFDAADWAEVFCNLFHIVPRGTITPVEDDQGLMIGWFSNALMRGYDQPRPAPAPETDLVPPLADATPEEIERAAQSLEILCARDPRHGPIYSELAISLKAEAARRRQS